MGAHEMKNINNERMKTAKIKEIKEKSLQADGMKNHREWKSQQN